jgi:hypothetical protein
MKLYSCYLNYGAVYVDIGGFDYSFDNKYSCALYGLNLSYVFLNLPNPLY